MHAETATVTAERRLRVLAADDNAANRLMLKTALELFGLAAVVVCDGAEAVEAWRRGRFDLILFDIEMPRMDGPTALAAIRADERLRGAPRAPAIAFSGHDLAGTAERKGFDLHVVKPIALGQLRQAIEAAAALMAADEPAGAPSLRRMV